MTPNFSAYLDNSRITYSFNDLLPHACSVERYIGSYGLEPKGFSLILLVIRAFGFLLSLRSIMRYDFPMAVPPL